MTTADSFFVMWPLLFWAGVMFAEAVAAALVKAGVR
jgi:hypothetical protein